MKVVYLAFITAESCINSFISIENEYDRKGTCDW